MLPGENYESRGWGITYRSGKGKLTVQELDINKDHVNNNKGDINCTVCVSNGLTRGSSALRFPSLQGHVSVTI